MKLHRNLLPAKPAFYYCSWYSHLPNEMPDHQITLADLAAYVEHAKLDGVPETSTMQTDGFRLYFNWREDVHGSPIAP